MRAEIAICRDSYLCAEIAVFVLNLSDILFLRTAPHTTGCFWYHSPLLCDKPP